VRGVDLGPRSRRASLTTDIYRIESIDEMDGPETIVETDKPKRKV